MGAVNIFLGGTGKFIAEDIQDSRKFYGLSIGDPVAFDLNATIRSGTRLSYFVAPDAQTTAGVTQLVGDWVTRNPGPALGPGTGADRPGPQRTPEHSVLVSIGEGILAEPKLDQGAYALRAHGLAIFSMLFDDQQVLAGTGYGNALRQHIDACVKAETLDGAAPRINIVTSTAGGTGAGMVIPLALWLKKRYPNSPLNLLAVTASAFAETLSAHPELRVKGLSGTYALFRELSYFRKADPQTDFPERRLPVTEQGLSYRPGGEPFDRVYWFGGRPGADSGDAFREAEPLLRVLSWDQTAGDLGAETGASPDKWIGAVTAIEYPKLRLQRRMVSRVLEDAYGSLRDPPVVLAGAQPSSVSLLDYVGTDIDRPLGAWFHAKRDSTMAQQAVGVTREDTNDLIRAVQGATQLSDYDDVSRGTDIPGGNYDSDEVGWQRYVNQVAHGLQGAANYNQEKLGATVAELRQAEETAFDSWLRGTVYGDWLSASGGGEPRATGEALKWLDALGEEASRYRDRFDSDGLFPVGTVEEANDRVQRREEKFEKPDERDASATTRDRVFSLIAAVVVGVLGAVVAGPVSDAIPEFAGGLSRLLPWVVVVALAIGARQIALGVMLRGRVEAATKKRSRQDAEKEMIAAYHERDRVRALRWLQQELRGKGEQKREPFFEVLRLRIISTRAAVKHLDDVYKGLQDRAAGDKEKVDKQPAHVREEVGDCLVDDYDMNALAARIRPKIRQRIAVEPTGTGLHLRLQHVDPDDPGHFETAVEDTADLDQALQAQNQVGYADAARALGRWEHEVEEVVNWQLDANLPSDFNAAMLHCAKGNAAAALHSLSTKLQNLDLPKPPSVALVGRADEPGHRRLYVGSNQILADLNAARGKLSGREAARLDGYWKNPPHVVSSLGEQIVFLDLWADQGEQLWAPNVIGNAHEIVENDGAMRTHYGVRPGVKAEWTAEGRAFTVIPELLAATKIELGAGTVDPLASAVMARLLGCDLDMQGPTYAELFYLLRHRGLLRSRLDGTGPGARTVTEIVDDDDDTLPLVSRPVGAVADAAFGQGRAAVIDYDTFVEFMRYDGTPLMAGQAVGFRPFLSAEPHMHDWAAAPARVAKLQRMAVEKWYGGDVEDDAAAMIEVLKGDLEAMKNGDAAVRSSWERAMRRLLAGEERKAIRRAHLSAGA